MDQAQNLAYSGRLNLFYMYFRSVKIIKIYGVRSPVKIISYNSKII